MRKRNRALTPKDTDVDRTGASKTVTPEAPKVTKAPTPPKPASVQLSGEGFWNVLRGGEAERINVYNGLYDSHLAELYDMARAHADRDMIDAIRSRLLVTGTEPNERPEPTEPPDVKPYYHPQTVVVK